MIQNNFKLKKLKGPWRITFDTNPDDCNLRCMMCEEFSEFSDLKETRILKGGGLKRRMDFSIIEQIIKNAQKMGNLKEIIPSTMGEPLLYKEFEKIITLCKKYNVKLNLTTNGTFPKRSVKEWAELLVPVTSDVKISWNGSTKETAESIMKGINFEKNLNNLKSFIEIRDRINNESGYFCSITLQVTFLEKNYREFPDLAKMAIRLGVNRLKGHHLWAHFKEIKDQSMRRSIESIDNWNKMVKNLENVVEANRLPDGSKLILENFYKLQSIEGNKHLIQDAICPFLGREVWVAWDGRFNPCCAPDEQRLKLGYFGNMNSTELDQIWNSKEYNNLIKNYMKNELCIKCNMRKPKEDMI